MHLKCCILKVPIYICKRYFHFSIRNSNPITDFTFNRHKKIYDPFYNNFIFGETPRTKVGGKYHIPMIKGSGVGPELMSAVETVFTCADAPVVFDVVDLPSEATDEAYEDMMNAVRRCGACIKAFIAAADNPTGPLSRNKVIRNDLNLYAYLRHYQSIPAIPTTQNKDIDIILISQNIEGEYSMLEHMPVPHIAENLKVVTRANTRKLAKFTFDIAEQSERKRVLSVYTEGATPDLFLDTIEEESKNYPNVQYELYTTSAAMHNIVLHPEREDVIIAESLCGSIISSCLFSLIGSPALVAGCNYGDRYAVFEPAARAESLSLAGKGIVNPTGALLCGVQLLRFLNVCQHADMIEDAVYKTIEFDNIFTKDMGGNATTSEFVENVAFRVREMTQRFIICDLDDLSTFSVEIPSSIPPFDQEIFDTNYINHDKHKYSEDD